MARYSVESSEKKRFFARGSFLRTLAVFTVAAVVSAGVSACSDDEEASPMQPIERTAQVRVIHGSHDAPDVDVKVDGSVAISALGYGESSGYATLPEGSYGVEVVPAGADGPVVISAQLPLQEDQKLTVMAVNTLASIEAIVAFDREPSTKALVRFIHASPDAPVVDIRAGSGEGPVLFEAIGFKGVGDYIEVDAGTYDLAVTPHASSDEVVVYRGVTLENGMMYTVVASGTIDATDMYPFTTRAFVDNGSGDASVELTDGAVGK